MTQTGGTSAVAEASAPASSDALTTESGAQHDITVDLRGDNEETPIKVLIVDDHILFAESIRRTLEAHGLNVLGIAGNEMDALPMARNGQPDLVLMDLNLPDADGAEAAKKIMKDCPDAKVLVVTSLTNPRRVTEIIRDGFQGYLTKDTPLAQFVSAVRAAIDGQVVMPMRVARAVAGSKTEEETNAALLADHLTTREHEVLTLLASGATSEIIAEQLSVSLNTVRTHIQNVLTKLQVHSRLEAATFAVKFGIVRVGN
jgi:two-component system, NarL family, nitrate/nitrite response regulator NarL